MRLDVTLDVKEGSIWHIAAIVDKTLSVNLFFSIFTFFGVNKIFCFWRQVKYNRADTSENDTWEPNTRSKR